jgi:tetratricopeptide (TPR) repeat protein
LFAKAVDANLAALEVRTKSDAPLGWANSQSSLGLALLDEGERSSGANATELLGRAVEAFRAALQVYAKADSPKDWATVQNSLGFALTDQAERSSDAQAKELLANAVDAYREALQVRTAAETPQDWEMTQGNLARALADQGDFTAASSALEASLNAFPDDVNALENAAFYYEEKLYRYERMRELLLRWLKIDASSTDARVEMLDADLTTNRFDECSSQAEKIDNTIFAAPAMPMIAIRDTLKLACQFGAGQKTAARATEKALLAESAGSEKIGWQFAGPRHFLASAPAFEAGRAAWIDLFEGLENGDRAEMAADLHRLEDVMQP